jgi:hypothetical protein
MENNLKIILVGLIICSSIILIAANGCPLTQNTTGDIMSGSSGFGSSVPISSTNLTLTPISQTQTDLTWLDNSTNEIGVKVERSTDNINFTQIALVAPLTTALLTNVLVSYSDTTVSPLITYYYKVRAYNNFGNSAYSNTVTSTATSDMTISTLDSQGRLGEIASTIKDDKIYVSYFDYDTGNLK